MLASLPSVYMEAPDCVYIVRWLLRREENRHQDFTPCFDHQEVLVFSRFKSEPWSGAPGHILTWYFYHTICIPTWEDDRVVDQVSSSSPEVFHERMGSFRAYHGVRFLIIISLWLPIHIFTAEPYRRGLMLPNLTSKLSWNPSSHQPVKHSRMLLINTITKHFYKWNWVTWEGKWLHNSWIVKGAPAWESCTGGRLVSPRISLEKNF